MKYWQIVVKTLEQVKAQSSNARSSEDPKSLVDLSCERIDSASANNSMPQNSQQSTTSENENNELCNQNTNCSDQQKQSNCNKDITLAHDDKNSEQITANSQNDTNSCRDQTNKNKTDSSQSCDNELTEDKTNKEQLANKSQEFIEKSSSADKLSQTKEKQQEKQESASGSSTGEDDTEQSQSGNGQSSDSFSNEEGSKDSSSNNQSNDGYSKKSDFATKQANTNNAIQYNNSKQSKAFIKQAIQETNELISLYRAKNNVKTNNTLPNKPKQSKNQSDKPNKAFLDELSLLPDFENRNRENSFGNLQKISEEDLESIMAVLFKAFLTGSFKREVSTLNSRNQAYEQTLGFEKWDEKALVVHLLTKQHTKVPFDKYGYDYSKGTSQQIPLSFYFDLSGSMSKYIPLLVRFCYLLLKKDIKVLIGFNEKCVFQIDSIAHTVQPIEVAKFIADSTSYYQKQIVPVQGIKTTFIDKNFDEFLIERRAEKVGIFADCDALTNICTLSKKTKLYWFNFEKNFTGAKAKKYGFAGARYDCSCKDDILKALSHFVKLDYNTLRKLEQTAQSANTKGEEYGNEF